MKDIEISRYAENNRKEIITYKCDNIKVESHIYFTNDVIDRAFVKFGKEVPWYVQKDEIEAYIYILEKAKKDFRL